MLSLQSSSPVPVSPLVLADRLISLAQDADRAGFADSATQLVSLAYQVLDKHPAVEH